MHRRRCFFGRVTETETDLSDTKIGTGHPRWLGHPIQTGVKGSNLAKALFMAQYKG